MKSFSLGQIGDHEIKQLKVFKTVVDCGGFSSAVTQLNISRPTISSHIANLESRLNLTLCKRGRSGFSLTQEGAVIYQQTCQLLEMLESFRNTINTLSTSPSGQLKIALSDTFSLDPRCRLPQIIKAFYQQAPDVELSIDVEHIRDMERKVLNEELDIAFIPYHRQLVGLNYIHLFSDNNYLYCGRDNPLYDLPEGLITEALINSSRMVHAGLKPHEEMYQQLSSMHLKGKSYHYESRIAMVLSGQYICFLPEYVAKPHVDCGDLKAIAINSKFFSLGVAVISKKSAQPNRAKDLFIKTSNSVFIGAESVAPY
jgi:DNA-binding transcriptional LysR family regulator